MLYWIVFYGDIVLYLICSTTVRTRLIGNLSGGMLWDHQFPECLGLFYLDLPRGKLTVRCGNELICVDYFPKTIGFPHFLKSTFHRWVFVCPNQPYYRSPFSTNHWIQDYVPMSQCPNVPSYIFKGYCWEMLSISKQFLHLVFVRSVWYSCWSSTSVDVVLVKKTVCSVLLIFFQDIS